MTDRPRPYHRAEAERLLDYADVWASQAGELSPKASERACLDRAAVHALFAIHDTLTAADRYAANEAKQREAEPDSNCGPLTFAPEAAQEATGGDLTASEGESGAEEQAGGGRG